MKTFNDLGALFNNWGDFQRSRSHFLRSLFKIDLRVLFRLSFFIFTHALLRISPLFFINIRVFVDPLYLFFRAPFFLFWTHFHNLSTKLTSINHFIKPKLKIKKSYWQQKDQNPKNNPSKNLKPHSPQPLHTTPLYSITKLYNKKYITLLKRSQSIF